MAGNYPDWPSNRMSLDTDGTTFFANNNQQTQTTLQSLNRESTGSLVGVAGSFSTGSVWLLFPEARQIFGGYVAIAGGTNRNQYFQYSTDTTNGTDGTWVSYSQNVDVANYRTITSQNIANCRGLKMTWSPGNSTGYITNWHVYGYPMAGQNPHRMEIWHPTLSNRVPASYFDWANVPRNSTDTRTFRVKNLSPTYTANSVNLTFSTFSDTTPSVTSQHYFSTNGTDFYGTINIGDLAPGALSPVIYVRRVTPANAVLSLWTVRINAIASSWS